MKHEYRPYFITKLPEERRTYYQVIKTLYAEELVEVPYMHHNVRIEGDLYIDDEFATHWIQFK